MNEYSIAHRYCFRPWNPTAGLGWVRQSGRPVNIKSFRDPDPRVAISGPTAGVVSRCKMARAPPRACLPGYTLGCRWIHMFTLGSRGYRLNP
jgi:hypothetical protein